MFVYNLDFCNKLAQLSLNHFKSLPKTGKPNDEEWTILSCIAKYDCIIDKLEIIALGTGSKCIGATKMSPKGNILNDSHAEVICRRAFLRYLYNEITLAFNEDKSIFKIINDGIKLKLLDSISFHFFTTHVPCGDASIFSKENCDDIGDCLLKEPPNKTFQNPNIRLLEHEITDSPNKKQKLDEDIFRTGAKCLENDLKHDPKQSGFEYHVLGAIRTKPGRGDPTLSVSCSDKLAKWIFVGIQGALISFFLEAPIYLRSITVAGNVPFSEDSILRCLKNRFNIYKLSEAYQHTVPLIGQADIPFEFCKNDSKRPCPSSITWSKVPLRPLEVSVDGMKQGVTKKNRNKKEGTLLICKKELFASFIDIIVEHKILNLDYLKFLSYKNVKESSEYFKIWILVKRKILGIWTVKDEKLLNFKFFDE